MKRVIVDGIVQDDKIKSGSFENGNQFVNFALLDGKTLHFFVVYSKHLIEEALTYLSNNRYIMVLAEARKRKDKNSDKWYEDNIVTQFIDLEPNREINEAFADTLTEEDNKLFK